MRSLRFAAARELLDGPRHMRALASIPASIVLCGALCGLLCAAAAGDAGARPARDASVSVMTARDASPEQLDADARRHHGQIARRAATESLALHGIDARRAGAADGQLDVLVTHWRIASAGRRTDVTAEIRIVLCDRTGRMLTIVNGKATISGDVAQLTELREQALAEGVRHLVARLGAQTSA
jgi:hypothetical protein